MTSSEKCLRRRPDQAMLGGVCAGLADHFGIDVSLVRAAFAGMTVFSGFGVVAYVALWYLLDPPQPGDAGWEAAIVEPEDTIEVDVAPVEEPAAETEQPLSTPAE